MIDIGSKWTKDGVVYEVVANRLNECIECIWYKDQQCEIHVDTEQDFLREFKPYEPIYEYQWIWYNNTSNEWVITTYVHQDNFPSDVGYPIHIDNFQRLDLTKRERKQ